MLFYKLIKYEPCSLPFQRSVNADALFFDLAELLGSENNKIEKFWKSIGETPFCIFLGDTFLSKLPIENKKIATGLIRIFFHPAYILNVNRPMLLMENKGLFKSEWQQFLIKEAKENGFDGLFIINLLQNKEDTIVSSQVVFYYDKPVLALEQLIEKWINRNWEVEIVEIDPIYLVIDSSNQGSILESIELEKELLKGRRDYQLACKLLSLKKINDKLRIKLKGSLTQEENVSNYLRFQKNDMVRILDFYKYEYEILPSWYKRIGHIIKVCMGRRTFLSLFRDDVKKYKK